MSRYLLILLFCVGIPASSDDHNEPFIDQLTRAQIWCEIVGQDVYELSMIRHKGISRSDFLEKGKERFQDLGHKLRERMNQEKEGVEVLRKLEAQIEEEIKRADNFWPFYERIIEEFFSAIKIQNSKNIEDQSKIAKNEFFNGCYMSFTGSRDQ
mgnify:CR=1 FL=1